jgi:hypothetical protein
MSMRLRAREDTSVLEAAHLEIVQNLEQLSSGRGQSSRGRSTRSATSAARATAVVTRQGRPASAQPRDVSNRAARTGSRNSVYEEVASDIDETEIVEQATLPRENVNGRAQRSHRAESEQFSHFERTQSELETGSERRSTRPRQASSAHVASSRPTRNSARISSGPPFGGGDLPLDATASAGRRRQSVDTEPACASEADEPRPASGAGGAARSRMSAATIDNYSDTEDDEASPRTRMQTTSKVSKDRDDSSFLKSQSENEAELNGDGNDRDPSSESDDDASVRSSDSESRAEAIRGVRSRATRSRSARNEDMPSGSKSRAVTTRRTMSGASRSRPARNVDESSGSESSAVATRGARNRASRSRPARYEEESSSSESRAVATRGTRSGASRSRSVKNNDESDTSPRNRKSAGTRARGGRARAVRAPETYHDTSSGCESEVSHKLLAARQSSESRAVATRGTRSGASRSRSVKNNDESDTSPRNRKSAGTRARGGRARAVRAPETYHDTSSGCESEVSHKVLAARQNDQKKPIVKKRKGKLCGPCTIFYHNAMCLMHLTFLCLPICPAKSIATPTKKIKTEVELLRPFSNLAKWSEIAIQNIGKVTDGVLQQMVRPRCS